MLQADGNKWQHYHRTSQKEPDIRRLCKPDPANQNSPDQTGVFGAGHLARIHMTVGEQHDDVVSHDEYLGGAHGAVFTQLQSFDLSTGNMINVTQKYDADKLLSLAETKFREIHKLDSEADLNDAGFMFEDGKFTLPENMGLTKEGVLMIYNSYEVASYAQGETRFTIPYSALKGNV